MNAPALAPEASAGIRAAQDELEQHASKLAAIGDPTASTARVFAVAASAINRLMVDATLKINASIDNARKPWTRAERQALIQELDNTLLHRWARLNRLAIGIGVALTVGFGALTFAGGAYWYAQRQHLAAVTNCVPAPQAAGEAWVCTFWVRYPTPGQR